MHDPFVVLNVHEEATDEEINKAYLQKVREYPPERDAERFREIRAAFETIRTLRDRLTYRLFHAEPTDTRALIEPLLQKNAHRRPSEKCFLEALDCSLKHE